MILGFAKVLSLVFAAAAVVSVVVLASLDNSLISNRKMPDPSTQGSIAYHVKGTTVYITAAEHQTITLAYYVEVVSLCSLAAIALLTRGKV